MGENKIPPCHIFQYKKAKQTMSDISCACTALCDAAVQFKWWLEWIFSLKTSLNVAVDDSGVVGRVLF